MRRSLYLLKRLFVEEWSTLLVVNLLAVLVSLPLVTIGPALLAMNGVLTRLVDDRFAGSTKDVFLSVFKQKFWRGIQLEAAAVVYILAMLWCVAVADKLEGMGQTLMNGTLWISLFLAAITSVHLVPLLSDSDTPFFQALWDSLLLAFARLPQTILAAVCVYGLLYGFWLLYPISIVPYAMIVLAAAAALSTAFTWPSIDELIFAEQ